MSSMLPSDFPTPATWSTTCATKDHLVHLQKLTDAYNIYVERDDVRGDLWRSRPPSHKLEMVREKLDRAQTALTRLRSREQIEQSTGTSSTNSERILAAKTEYEDSLLDLINFAVFAIREVQEGQRD